MERTLTFTMEDALISPAGFMILSGAGLIEGNEKEKIQVHATEQTNNVYVINEKAYIITEEKLSTHKDASIYVMVMDNGEISTEPYVGTIAASAPSKEGEDENTKAFNDMMSSMVEEGRLIVIDNIANYGGVDKNYEPEDAGTDFTDECTVMVDYYVEKGVGAQQIEITADKFGGNYYLEASTLFRDTNGVDMPAEFIIPNCKIQSNFNFSMASTGDPSELMRLAA